MRGTEDRKRAFTLIELLVVLVIVGMLVGVVAPRLFQNVGKSEVTTTRAQIDALSKAVDQYRLDNGRFPDNQEGLSALLQRPADTPDWKGPYLQKAVPQDPWGQPYHYQAPGVHSPDYDLYSYGPDRKAGGENEGADIGNW